MAQRGNRNEKAPAPTRPSVVEDGSRATPDPAAPDESSGEEHDFELANAMADLETIDDRAARREHDADAARADDAIDGDEVLED